MYNPTQTFGYISTFVTSMSWKPSYHYKEEQNGISGKEIQIIKSILMKMNTHGRYTSGTYFFQTSVSEKKCTAQAEEKKQYTSHHIPFFAFL